MDIRLHFWNGRQFSGIMCRGSDTAEKKAFSRLVGIGSNIHDDSLDFISFDSASSPMPVND